MPCVCESIENYSMPYDELRGLPQFDSNRLPVYLLKKGNKWYLQAEYAGLVNRIEISHCPKCGRRL